MGRTTGSSGPATFEAIRRAGLRLIYEHGYEAMTLRQLAAEIGLVQASLYNHIATKQDLLFKLVTDHMQDLLQHVDEALEGRGDPSDQLTAFVEFHVTYHIDRKQEVFISYSELRSLEPKNFEVVVAMRRDYEQKLIDILRAGAALGQFTVSDPKTVAFGLLSLLSGICNWFKPDGRLSKAQVCAIFLEMARGAVNDRQPRSGIAPKSPAKRSRGKQLA